MRRGRQNPHLRHQQASRAHQRALARHAGAERHGRRRRPHPAAYRARQDLRLRISAQGERHFHVPPALRRNGADGHGHDGHVHRHPRDESFRRVDRDFVFMMSSYAIDPGTALPRVSEMTDFNMWTWNNRVFPGIDPLPVRFGDKVRVRMANLTMTNHPIHLHGFHFAVTCTDGGWVPESAQWPHATVDVPVGEIRAIDFVANNPGDWAFHCHKSHHTMNAMGHNTRNLIGAKQKQLTKAIRSVVPDYMPMGSAGMAEMGAMEMPLPDNTLPMMTGFGQFGPLEMGGMFTVVKVREDLAVGDYKDPGPYKFPPGGVAHEFTGDAATVPRQSEPAAPSPHKQH